MLMWPIIYQVHWGRGNYGEMWGKRGNREKKREKEKWKREFVPSDRLDLLSVD